MRSRWSECWQFLTEYPGTFDQQEAVRYAFHLEHGTPKHRLFQRLDRSINSVYKRSFLTFGFLPDDMWSENMLAIAGITGINLRASYSPDAVGDQALHELTHVLDKHLLTAGLRLDFMVAAGIDPNLNTWNHNVQEMFADAGRDWFKGESKLLDPIFGVML